MFHLPGPRWIGSFAGPLLLLSLTGCGSATGGILGLLFGQDDGGDGGNAAPVVSAVQVSSTRTSPAEITFRILDAESDPVDVEIGFTPPWSSELILAELEGDSGLTGLATSLGGVTYTKLWDFAGQVGESYQEGFAVTVKLSGPAVPEGIPSATAIRDDVSLGNDPPVIVSALPPPAPESSGNVEIPFTVADTSADLVSIVIELDVIGDDPDEGWKIARPAGTPAAEPTPPFAFVNLATSAGGVAETFVWDTSLDLGGREVGVRLRFHAIDGVTSGQTLETEEFWIDNNDAPVAVLSNDQLISSLDQRRGIPIPFQITDTESDPTRILLQWRRSNEQFVELPGVDLPGGPADLIAILEDPELRKQHQIATEMPLVFEGRIAVLDPPDPEGRRIRLPDLGSSAAHLVARGIVGQELQILRASSIPEPIAAGWTQNPLQAPVAALPLGDGVTALILDRPVAASWRLREIELATGTVVTEIATGSGDPDAMTYEPGETSVLVAADQAGVWQVHRVPVGTGAAAPTLLITADGSTELGAVRGLVSLGRDAALITVSSSLIRLDFAEGSPAEADPLFGPPPLFPLSAPWGIVLDPVNTNRVYLAENGAERVVALELDTLAVVQVVANASGSPNPASLPLEPSGSRLLVATQEDTPRATCELPGLPNPEALALERSGSRLLVVTRQGTPGATRELRGVHIGGGAAGEVFQVFPPRPSDPGFLGTVGSMAAGPRGLRLVALPEKNELAAGGGVEQKRSIAAYQASSQVVTVDQMFQPPLDAGVIPLAAGRRWRVSSRLGEERPSSPAGTPGVFLWESGDLAGGDAVGLRMIPLDENDVGIINLGGKTVLAALDVSPVLLNATGASGPNDPVAVAAADLDGDGDVDLVSANPLADTLTIFFQSSQGDFPSAPDLELEIPGVPALPVSVAAADLNGDGDLDLVSANSFASSLTVFFQSSPGEFPATPDLELGSPATMPGPRSVAAADLDGDGDLDLVSANGDSNTLTIFLQTSPGGFPGTPDLELGSFTTTRRPSSVAAADLDGDGDLDLVSANVVSDTLTVFFQPAAGFSSTADPDLVLGSSTATNGPSSVAAADLDGDGDLDLVSANANSSNLTAFFQTSPGQFPSDPDLDLGGIGTTPEPIWVVAADLDGDGQTDLVSANLDSPADTLTVFFQDGAGQFSTAPDVVLESTLPLTELGLSAIATADLDGDSGLDLIAANGGELTLSLFYQATPGQFFTVPELVLGSSSGIGAPWDVTAADLDGDGDLDLVSASLESGTLAVFFQTGPGQFPSTPDLVLGSSATTNGPRSVAAADLDGDGDLDLVSANFGSDTLTVFFQPPAGFSSTADPDIVLGSSAMTIWPVSVAAGDLDGDGDLDLVSANMANETLTVFFQPSAGFSSTADPDIVLGGSAMTGPPLGVTAADLDGDGDLDLVSANWFSNTLMVFFQPAAGFSSTPDPDIVLGSSATTNGPQSIAATDLDGDGDMDLVSANELSDTLTVFFQPAAGFSSTPDPDLVLGSSATTDGPESVAAVDLDGDGDLDLVSANWVSDTLTVFLQTAPGMFSNTPDLVLGSTGSTETPSAVTVADLDGDGEPDLVSSNNQSGTLTVFFGGQ